LRPTRSSVLHLYQSAILDRAALAAVGFTRSANCSPVQPPTTRTHWPAGALGLLAQHPQGGTQRADPVPAQLEQVVVPTANDVQVGVVQPRDHPAAERVDDAGRRADVRGDGWRRRRRR